ncbi:glucose-6-phosphate dehydrogenase [Agromyces neolithicus]|uniref:Glucose-6-phosphate 1-dehydrogenase n=1 Tax=Agromyces neolithicus TaxID=269420 RepID=A0ABP4XZM1_9MICO
MSAAAASAAAASAAPTAAASIASFLPAAGADDPKVEIPDPHVVVLFGASGDLSARKLLPGFYHLERAGLLPAAYRIVGTATDELDDESFAEHARQAVEEFGRTEVDAHVWDRFAARLSYVPTTAGPAALGAAVSKAREELGECRLLHYLAVPPAAFGSIIATLVELGLNGDDARVILEKPFGHDYDSAVALNRTLEQAFDDAQIFRIDHFLGKEAVQNILALRFANGLYEPLWNRTNIEFVQIDVPETLSIGDRAGFYEGTGAYRDMVVTHLLQLLSYIAMEPPVELSAKALRDEKTKVMQSMRMIDPAKVVRGQYEGYLDEDGVAPDSGTETFIAMEVQIDNWRWAGVPIHLRTGKCMAESRRTVVLDFHEPPMRMFPDEAQHQGANQLVFDLSEPGSITADFQAKVPGPTMRLGPARMIFRYEQSFETDNQLMAYERLIHDAMLGDATLFTGAEGIERLWAISADVLADPGPLHPYPKGSWGPEAAQHLVAPFSWRLPEADSTR